MLVNFNEELIEAEEFSVSKENRAFRYGDAVFETMKYSDGAIHFWEDHYFRLMSAMRIIRMEIPMNFTPEYLEEQIRELIGSNHLEKQSASIRLTVYRAGEGKYTPESMRCGMAH